jgi:hypothetical protein
MTVHVDDRALLAELAPLLEGERCRAGLRNLASDPFFVAFFLASVSQGEGLGEAAVAMIGEEELASRIRDLDKQEREERGHKERTIDAARALFPEYFREGCYLYADRLEGMPYYVAVLEAVRRRLKEEGRYSRLNLYLTTTFGYEVMVLLLYAAVAQALRRSHLPDAVRIRVADVIDGILAEEETHVGVVDQHNALLALEEHVRARLSRDAREMLDALAGLSAGDYRFAADLAVRQVASMMDKYAEPERYRAEIARGGAAAPAGA